jgi:hypothetical protein
VYARAGCRSQGSRGAFGRLPCSASAASEAGSRGVEEHTHELFVVAILVPADARPVEDVEEEDAQSGADAST